MEKMKTRVGKMKRILDCTASDFQKMDGKELRQAIAAAEGRTVLAEVVCTVPPIYPSVTNAELAAAFGADLILLNVFDVDHPEVFGLETKGEETVRQLKKLVGRPVGINLEPVDPNAERLEALYELPQGRRAVEASLVKAKQLGVDFVCLTGNPKTGVTNRAIVESVKTAKKIFGEEGLVIAGKMHGAGVKGESGGSIVDEETVASFVDAGADVVLIPGVGTVPGTTLEKQEKLIQTIHEKGALALTAIGTSQEGAGKETVSQMALYNKMAGADIHHIGDAGIFGIADPENIMAYSIAIRGRRHTYVRMAASVLR
jgi:hypothetical protein